MILPVETVEHLQRMAGAALKAEPITLDTAPDLIARVIPQGWTIDTTDLTKYQPTPQRRRGHPVFHHAVSFAAYVLAQKVTGTTLYADVAGKPTQITALIDGHEPADGEPGWGEHRASLLLRATPAWQRWTAMSGQEKSAEDFAEFLEDNAADVVQPDAATLIELARTLEVHKDVQYVNVTRPTSGARRLHYEETVTARAGESGAIDIPETLQLGLAPWEGSDRFAVTAKFRFRLRGGVLKLAVELVRPDAVLEAAFGAVLAQVAEATGLEPLHGHP